MDFDLSEEQLLIRDTMSRFLVDNFTFENRQSILSSDNGYLEEHWVSLSNLGILALPISEKLGGIGGTTLDCMLVMEQMGRVLFTGPYLATSLLAGKVLEQADTEENFKNIFSDIINASRKLTLAFAERDAGYDITGTKMRAEKEGVTYRLCGEKCAVFHAGSADDIIVLARTSGKTGDRGGLSLFLIPCNTSGLKMFTYPTQDGNRAADILFNSLIIPENYLIGTEGNVFEVVDRVIDQATATLIGEAVGIMWEIYNLTLEYLKTRTQFGKVIGSFQALQHRMVDMYMMCEMAQSMAYEAAFSCDHEGGNPDFRRKSVSSAKSLVGRYSRKVGQEGIQLHGAIGMTMEVIVGHYFKRLCMIDSTFGDVAWHETRYTHLS